VNTIHVLHDPKRGELPGALAKVYRENIVMTDFDGDTSRCERCGRDRAGHVWMLIDPDESDQGGVLDCGIVGEGA
jgi:hypothetical protein